MTKPTTPDDAEGRTARRAAINRANVEKRWAPIRAARLAAGLPPTREIQYGRSSRFLSDPEEESFWLAECTRLNIAEGESRTVRRMAAKKLAEAQVRELARAAEAPQSASAGDDDVLLDYWQEEALRWHRRADRDLAMADAHRAQAQEAEREVAYLVLARNRRTGA